MKISLVVAVVVAVLGHGLSGVDAKTKAPTTAPPPATPAPTPAPTKVLRMNGNIVPTWDDIVDKASTKKIKLKRVKTYWDKLETRDKEAFASLYTVKADKNAAKDKVDEYYTDAYDCLKQHKLKKKIERTAVETALAEVQECIYGKPAPPSFDALVDASLPADYDVPVKVDFSKDEEEEDTEADSEEIDPTPVERTTTPVVTPSEYLEPFITSTGAETESTDATTSSETEPFTTSTDATTSSETEPFTTSTGATTSSETEPFTTSTGATTSSETEPYSASTDTIPSYSTGLLPEEGADQGFVTITEEPGLPFSSTTSPEVPASHEVVANPNEPEPKDGVEIWVQTEAPEPKDPIAPGTGETHQPEPVSPVEVKVVPTGLTEPPQPLDTTEGETVAPEPQSPVVVDVPPTGPQEPTDAPGTSVSTETIQPEPEEPAIVVAPPPRVTEPADEPTGPSETIQPEPLVDAEITNAPQFVEPGAPVPTTADPSTQIEQPEPPVYDSTTLTPTDPPVILSEPDAPEFPADANHDLPPVVPTEAPFPTTGALTEPEHPEKPEYNPPPVDSSNEPVIISEPNPPEHAADAPEYNSPPISSEDESTTAPVPTSTVEVVYEKPSGETTAPEPYGKPTGEQGVTDTGVGGEPSFVSEPHEPYDLGVLDPTYIPEPLLDEPTEEPDVVLPKPEAYPFSPVSRDVPPLWALDMDASSSVDANEWQIYVNRLRGIALARAANGEDEVAVHLLGSIINFHYASLGHCIHNKLVEANLPVVDDRLFTELATWIEQNCYVKFRYSLFAGPPPFEWVAKKEPTVTAATIEKWFTRKVAAAKKDQAQGKAIVLNHTEHEILERLVGCTYKILRSAGETPIRREHFYAALNEIDHCASE